MRSLACAARHAPCGAGPVVICFAVVSQVRRLPIGTGAPDGRLLSRSSLFA
jgi:hypothetical protein